jgi:tetratricopeptide (TPR) repeat protein
MTVSAVALVLAGCVSTADLAGDLGDAMATQSDPQVIRDGAPAYLIMADALVRDDPDDADVHFAAARLYTAYTGAFVDQPERRKRLSQRALDYAARGLCLRHASMCGAREMRFQAFRTAVEATFDDAESGRHLYRFASAWAGWIQARSDDYGALADLPAVELAFRRVLEIAPQIDHGNAHVYLGVLLAQRPRALGGQPEAAREHFEQAISISDGRNLMARILYAEHYARLVFDRELHDRLVEEVLAAEPEAGDLTLSNALARERARELRASADDFF